MVCKHEQIKQTNFFIRVKLKQLSKNYQRTPSNKRINPLADMKLKELIKLKQLLKNPFQ